MGKTCRLICSQLLFEFDIQLISVFENAEFKLIVMCNLYTIFTSSLHKHIEKL